MTRRNIIIPEVISNNIKSNPSPNEKINISLSKHKTDNRRYEINHNIHTTNNTTINNQNRGMGFFQFIIFMITLPFVIIYKIFSYLNNLFQIKNKIKYDSKKESVKRLMRKWVKKHKDIYSLDEVY
jgi:hypothetical protein